MPRRWLHFSVRSLLLLVTILSCAVGRLTYNARLQAAIVRDLRRCGAIVLYDFEFDGTIYPRLAGKSRVPRLLLDTLGVDFFHSPVCVDLYSYQYIPAPDSSLSQIRRLPNLVFVCLHGEQARDSTMEAVASLSNLEELHCVSAEYLTDVGIAHVRRLTKLKVIEIDSARITNRSLRVISRLPALEELTLSGIPLNDESLCCLKNMQRLRRLSIPFSIHVKITDAAMPCVASLKSLEILHLHGTNVTPEGVRCLTRLSRLKYCSLYPLRSVARDLRRAIPNCTVVP